MNDSKKRHLAEQVRRMRARFVQSVGAVLSDVLPMQTLTQWIRDECDSYRQRIYDPLKNTHAVYRAGVKRGSQRSGCGGAQ